MLRQFRSFSLAIFVALGWLACSDATLTQPGGSSGGPNPPSDDGGGGPEDEDGGSRVDSGPLKEAGPDEPSNLRVMAANISSGNASTYQPLESIRIIQALKPDVGLMQEMIYKTNSPTDLAEFVSTAFGAGYTHFVEPSGAGIIPNGVVSRYPITMSGRWTDPSVANRGFVYAKIAVPGPRPLWAVSVHLLTSNQTARNTEATALVGELKKVIAPGDYIVIGGDLNTGARTEPCLTTFKELVDHEIVPVDQDDNDYTNSPRSEPYDWVLPSPTLTARQVPTKIATSSFPTGLVFDTRVYKPISDVPPAMVNDSAAINMQHMAVVKDFNIPQ